MDRNFLQILKKHRRKYSLMEPQDVGKLIYQSEFGPEHMVCDKGQAESSLIGEWNVLPKDSGGVLPGRGEFIREVSSSLCRFPLSVCETADEAKLLAHLFTVTAGEHRGTMKGLEEKLEQLKTLHIPGMEEWAAAWKQEGYPPVHHSRIYRETYHPHYRLIKKEYSDYFPILFEIYRLAVRDKPAVIAIDGRCGSGKTYLAGVVGKLFPCNICHMDDFYLPLEQRQQNWKEIPGGNMDLERFLAEVLRPIRAGQKIFYHPYDCRKNGMGEVVQMPYCNLTVIEGSYSCHPALAAEHDLTIFLTCGREEQRKRLQMREGAYFSAFEKVWIPMEENYLQRYSIETSSRLIMDTGTLEITDKNKLQKGGMET